MVFVRLCLNSNKLSFVLTLRFLNLFSSLIYFIWKSLKLKKNDIYGILQIFKSFVEYFYQLNNFSLIM